MPTINEMIDFCEDMAAYDCFSNEQFARREMFYAISDELKKALREQKRPSGEWIACSDRLPEIRFDLNSRTSDTVFVCLENQTMHMAFYCDDNVWRFCESGEAKEPMWDKVVAWMPLPEPYKREGDKE